MKLGLAEILKRADDQGSKEEKIVFLRKHDSPALRKIIDLTFNPNVKWDLPKGAPPYKPTEFLDQEGRLYSELRRLYLFLEGGNPNLTKVRREYLFIQLLESVAPLDAELLIGMKDGKLPFKSITKKLLMEAFPGLLQEDGDVKNKT